MSGGNLMVRFKAMGTAYAVWEPVDPGFMKLRTNRGGTADEIEANLWEEILWEDSAFRRYVRAFAEKCEASRCIGQTDFDGNVIKMYTEEEMAQREKMISFNPDWVSPPGDTIKDIVDEINAKGENFWDIPDIGRELALSMEDTEKLLNGELDIDENLAFALSMFLGSTPDFWMKREENYREHLKRKREERIKHVNTI